VISRRDDPNYTDMLQGPRQPDLRMRLLRLYLIVAALVFSIVLLFAFVMRNRIQRDVIDAQLALAQALTVEIDSAEPVLSAVETLPPTIPSSYAIIAADMAGNIIWQTDPPTDSAWQRWQQTALHSARLNPDMSLTTVDPDGSRHLVVAAITPDDGIILVSQPTRIAYATADRLVVGIVLVVGIPMLLGVGIWWALSRKYIDPLSQLVDFSEAIRWRGHLREDEYAQLHELAQQQSQLGTLAESLLAMERETNHRYLQLATLLETSRVVASSLDVDEVIGNILTQVETLFAVQRCAVVALDQRAGVFRIRASRGLSAEYVTKLRIEPSEPTSASMRALRKQMPIQIADTETDLAYTPFRARSEEEGFRSVLAIPLATVHAQPAVLLLYKAEPYSYSYSELELASSFANQATMAMENAALYAQSDERLQEQTRRLEAVVNSMSEGLILESLAGQILLCNQQAARMIGMERDRVKHVDSAEILRTLLNSAEDPELIFNHYRTALTATGDNTFDLTRETAQGRRQDLRIHSFGVTDARGQLLGRGQVWQDITHDRELDRMKSALLSTVSHELRTPLATIKGYASTLLAPDVQWDEASQHEFLQTISNEADRLAALVKNLLDMSRIEAGMLEIQRETYSLNDIIPQIISTFAPDVRDRLRLAMDADLPPVPVDVPRISTAARNLVENAVKYSPPDTPIELITRRSNGSVQFAVRDYGEGVPLNVQTRIFERFYRLDNTLTRRVGGVGLGLSICKGFVEAHDGNLWLQAEDPGTTFGFSLPIEMEM
jgi:PAS domain S-box-containing protein